MRPRAVLLGPAAAGAASAVASPLLRGTDPPRERHKKD